MTAIPTALYALLTRTQLMSVLTETYAKARNVTPDDSYARLDEALRNLRLLKGLQDATWIAMLDAKPDVEPDKIIAAAHKRALKRKQFKAAIIRRRDEAAWTALTVLIDYESGHGSTEAMGILDTPEGEEMLELGFDVAGAFIAKQLV